MNEPYIAGMSNPPTYRLSADEIKALMYSDDDAPPLPIEFDDGRMVFGPVVSLSIPADGRVQPVDDRCFDVTKPARPRSRSKATITLQTLNGFTITRLRDDVSREPEPLPPYQRDWRRLVIKGDEPIIVYYPAFVAPRTAF